jgi:hypothetical protein
MKYLKRFNENTKELTKEEHFIKTYFEEHVTNGEVDLNIDCNSKKGDDINLIKMKTEDDKEGNTNYYVYCNIKDENRKCLLFSIDEDGRGVDSGNVVSDRIKKIMFDKLYRRPSGDNSFNADDI